MGTENLNSFFNPKTIAVIGASEREGSLGSKIFSNLIEFHKDSVFPVNPFRTKVHGISAYPNVSCIPSKIDLAIIATPAHTIPQIVDECGKAGIKGIIIVSAGFSDNDKSGQELSRKILEYKKNYGMRIIGPNSFGVIRPKSNFYATFAGKRAFPGKIAFISQSAALCGSFLDWSSETQVGLSGIVSTGFTSDVDLGELIDYFGTDPQTRCIMIYVEMIKNLRSFMSAARGFARTKPIIIVKACRLQENLESTRFFVQISKDKIFDAAFRRVGVVRVENLNELFDCAKALTINSNPKEENLTIITNASGPAVLAVDLLTAKGGKIAQLSIFATEKLKEFLPYYCNLSNPIDILEEATPNRFRKTIEVCLIDPTVNNLHIIHTSLGATNPLELAKTVIELTKQTKKNVLISLIGEDNECQEARKILNKNGIPAFRSAEEAIHTFRYMCEYTQNLNLLYQTPEELALNLETPIKLKTIIRKVFCEGRNYLNLSESLSFIEAYKIPIVKTSVAYSIKDAESVASEIGYPITMKPLFCSKKDQQKFEDISSKACSSSEISPMFTELVEKTKCQNHPSDFQGIAIQLDICKKGSKFSVGSRKDPQFGAIILFGRSEATKNQDNDISIGFPPLNQILAKQIVENFKTSPAEYLEKTTRDPQASIKEEILVKFSQLITDFPEIKEAEINFVESKDCTICAADASITIDRDRIIREVADHYEHMIIAPYPQKYITKRTLKDGSIVKLRPIKPEDEIYFNQLFKSLSEESVRFRFFETIKELSHDTLTRYCNLDYDREIAIVAELQNNKKIIGAVRIVLEAKGKKAEFAIMVGDAWQGLGLGSKLMDLIVDIAKDLKLESIYSYVTRLNSKMINMCSQKGFEIIPVDEYTINMSKQILP